MMEAVHEGLEKVDWERPETVVTKNIDWKGEIVTYNSGRTDIFSDVLLEKAANSEVNLGLVVSPEDWGWKPQSEEDEENQEGGGAGTTPAPVTPAPVTPEPAPPVENWSGGMPPGLGGN